MTCRALWGDQFTHPPSIVVGHNWGLTLYFFDRWWFCTSTSLLACSVGCGIKMGQERYTAEISVPTTVVVLPLQQRAAYFFPYNTPTLSTLLPYNASVARLCALCPSRYLDRIWRGTNWKSPKYAHVPISPLWASTQCDTIQKANALSCGGNAFYNQAFGKGLKRVHKLFRNHWTSQENVAGERLIFFDICTGLD